MKKLLYARFPKSPQDVFTTRYIEEIKNYARISLREEIDLIHNIKQGDQQAIEKLTKSHLKLVLFIANHYYAEGFSFNDIVGRGNVGLIQAVQTFDETKGSKFGSYAFECIRRNILSEIGKLSPHISQSLKKKHTKLLSNYITHFEQRYHRYPYVEELCDNKLQLTKKQIMTIFSLYSDIPHKISLEDPIQEDTTNNHLEDDTTTQEDDTTTQEDDIPVSYKDILTNSIADTNSADNYVMTEELKKDIEFLISIVDYGQRKQILEMFFGLGKYTAPCSIKNISEIIGLPISATKYSINSSLNTIRKFLRKNPAYKHQIYQHFLQVSSQ